MRVSHSQLKKFVTKYTVAMASLMIIKCSQVVLIVVGANRDNYYSDSAPDGYAWIRYVSHSC